MKKECMNYVVFDLETTGLYCDRHEIIEIGAIKVKDNKIVDKFQMLVKPKKKIRKNIISLTNITNEMVENALPIEEVLPKFIEFIEKLPLVAHNVDFHYDFINENYKRIYGKQFRRKKICTLKLMKKYIKKEELKDCYFGGYKLLDLIFEFFGIEGWEKYKSINHRALIDAEMVYKVYNDTLYFYV